MTATKPRRKAATIAAPDATSHNPAPEYLRALIGAAGVSQARAAHLLGIDARTMRRYLAEAGSPGALPAPYLVQFALERLADAA